MKNKLTLLAIVLLASVLVVSGCIGQSSDGGSSIDGAATGRAVFSASDAALDMENVEKVEVTIDKIEVKGESEARSKVVLEQDRTIDLMELRASGAQELLADMQLEAGNYTQIVMDVKSVVVTKTSGETEDAKLPSNKLRIIADFEIKANTTTATNVDFLLDKSLHTTGNGKIILAPVLKVESSEEAEVNIESNNVVVASSKSQIIVNQGMDVNGDIKADFELPANVDLDIDALGNVKVGVGTGIGIGIGNGNNNPKTVEVQISASGFSSSTVTINKGDTVKWTNSDGSNAWPATAMHPTHTVYPGSDINKCGTSEESSIFDACKGLAQGKSYQFTFNEKGEWKYHNHLNPSQTGTVVVE